MKSVQMEQFLCGSGDKKSSFFQIHSDIGEWTSLTPEIENNGFANDLGTGKQVIWKKLMSQNY